VNHQPTGTGASDPGLNWETAPGDDEVARKVASLLEDRPMLFSNRFDVDGVECVTAAIKSRAFLTEELTSAKAGNSLSGSLLAMRAALRTFIDAAGPNARNFEGRSGAGYVPYRRALEALRAIVGLHMAIIVDRYGIEIDPSLAQILPDVSADDSHR
jgi:hypothetical protein